MALKAAGRCVLVNPSEVKNNERETPSGLTVVGDTGGTPVHRGVILHVGVGIQEGFDRGDVLHYTSYLVIGEFHVVPCST